MDQSAAFYPMPDNSEPVTGAPPALSERRLSLAPEIGDTVKTTTCYMCACRCGIRVHLKDGAVKYIEGNPDHPVNKGVLCAKGAAGIMQHNSPARLTKPLKRVGPRGSGEFEEIDWDEALSIAAGWLGDIRRDDPRRLAFFTGRDQSQAMTAWWAAKFGTPNYAAHGGFCSVNMAAAGLYSIGGSFWEFGEPDWEHTRYFMMFGVAEDHDSNPIKMGLGKLKRRPGVKYVSVNPVRTGYAAIADEWIGIRPGSDGLFVMALARELLRTERVDWGYLGRYTNAPWLVIDDPGAADHGLFARDERGRPLCFDAASGGLANALSVDAKPKLAGEYRLADGRRAVPSFQLVAERILDSAHSPEEAARQCDVSADTIRRIAAELAEAAFENEVELDIPWVDWAGRRHDKMIGRPVAIHAMRGISAHANGFHTCRNLHILQMLLGSIDCPGGFRYKPPFPKPVPPSQKPAACQGQPERPLDCMPLGFPGGPEDLLHLEDGRPMRIDGAFSWAYPLAIHGMMHTVIRNAALGDPYPIDTLFMFMANMGWNSAMNVADTLKFLTATDPDTGDYKIPHVIYADAYYSETVPYADLVLPDTTYLERWDCISMMDRPICDANGAADAIRQPVVAPDRDVRPFQDVLLDLGARLGLPGMIDDDGAPQFPGGYRDYLVHHERAPEIGPLAGWRGAKGDQHGFGAPNPDQLQRYIDNGCFWRQELEPRQRYYKFANFDYLEHAYSMGWIPSVDQIVLQLYCETLQKFRNAAAAGLADAHDAARIIARFDPLPLWYPPGDATPDAGGRGFSLHAVTQRPAHMYHSWGSQNAWLRQITSANRLYMQRDKAAEMGLEDDETVWIVSRKGRIKGRIRLMDGVNPNTVWTWNAIGKRAGAWGLDAGAPEATMGFLLNQIIPEQMAGEDGRYAFADPVTGQAAWYDLMVRLEKCTPGGRFDDVIAHPPLKARPGGAARPARLRFGADLKGRDSSGKVAPDIIPWLGGSGPEKSP